MPRLLEERWEEKSAPAPPGDKGVCRQAAREQGAARPGWKLTKGLFLGGSGGIMRMSGGCSLEGAQLHLHMDEPNPNNHK